MVRMMMMVFWRHPWFDIYFVLLHWTTMLSLTWVAQDDWYHIISYIWEYTLYISFIMFIYLRIYVALCSSSLFWGHLTFSLKTWYFIFCPWLQLTALNMSCIDWYRRRTQTHLSSSNCQFEEKNCTSPPKKKKRVIHKTKNIGIENPNAQ